MMIKDNCINMIYIMMKDNNKLLKSIIFGNHILFRFQTKKQKKLKKKMNILFNSKKEKNGMIDNLVKCIKIEIIY